MRWVLPDYLRDELPPAAEHLERLRRELLDLFRLHGYQLVAPPLSNSSLPSSSAAGKICGCGLSSSPTS